VKPCLSIEVSKSLWWNIYIDTVFCRGLSKTVSWNFKLRKDKQLKSS
jgi:hypothetical protein